ncbi:MAG: tetratricopeptide repeat protein [Saprospiraceae bacterium]|uniref:Tetratricopeptide repeat protein n=1 Tax=Candidatus Opimibacter skivensis TaxID=2982028 RepID=A0A9D7XPC2_9BACT|nr:tetratricopeptide repeat protein [Candidatus Opimibacter skivensis]
MKKNILFFICLLQIFNSNLCVAQNTHKLDSLLNELSTAKEDSDKVFTLNAVSRLFWQSSDYLKARKYAEDALKLSEEINYGKGKAGAYTNIGITYEDQGDFSKALEYFLIVIKISEEISDKKGQAHGYLECGNIYYYKGNYPEALNSFFTANKLYEEIGDMEGVASGHITMGVINYEQGNFTEGVANILAALKIEETRGDTQAIAGCYINLALIYTKQHNYTDALRSNFSALKIMERIGDKKSSFNCYNNISQIYILQKDYVKALNYSLAALKIAEGINDKKSISYAYINIGTAYIGLKEYKEARKYLEDALSISKGIGSKDGITDVYLSLASLDSAVGNYNLSLKHYKLYIFYKDSLLNENKSRQIEEMKTKYESEKKDNEIILLTKDKELQNSVIKRQKLVKYYFIAGIVTLLLFFILFYKNYQTKQLLKLQTLRNRIAIDLHDDVGSTLSSITIFSELAKQQSNEAIHLLDNISESSRKMLESMADIVWTINPENDNFEKIIWRMRSFAYELLRAKNIDFEFTADENVARLKLPMEVRKNLYLIFKEAINNMVKYAGADRAFFSINGTKNNLTMVIRDNGKGFDVNQPSEGNGLKNMKKRAEEIGGKLLIDSGAGKGTTIQFLLITA